MEDETLRDRLRVAAAVAENLADSLKDIVAHLDAQEKPATPEPSDKEPPCAS